jgi:hypothetical protein
MDAQLHLIRVDPPHGTRRGHRSGWRLSEDTIRTGQRGVALARAAMRSSRAHRDDADGSTGTGRRVPRPVRGHAA